MIEPIRLVIWDLDETFWKGTLTEGGITEYVQAHHDVVVALARRGIISSICSRNDHDTVRRILERAGIWEYFVMPSIDWQPKGPRIAALIEAVQLRPATVLFIDDNPMNHAEARAIVPDLQVQSDEFIPFILSHPLFEGTNDTDLQRLKHYKMLEGRRADEVRSGSDLPAFLRSCDIRVRFDYEVHANLDRAVELINRTNQLNFTKKRLPEDLAAARAEFLRQISGHDVRAALVGVRDRYGDHGWCGIYVQHNTGTLIHYAFSCRILGMQVETWLYRKLGRPGLDVQGEVLTDVKHSDGDIDWVRAEHDGTTTQAPDQVLVDHLVARGGCDLMPVAHYFGTIATSVTGEFNENRLGMDVRVDHSTLLASAVARSMTDPMIAAAGKLGYEAKDFRSDLTAAKPGSVAWVLSFWTDAAYVVYRHRALGFTVPFALPGYHDRDARAADLTELRTLGANAELLAAVQALKDEYDYVGYIAEPDFKHNLRLIFALGARMNARIYVVTPNQYFISHGDLAEIMHRQQTHSSWTKDVAAEFTNVAVVNIRDFVTTEADVHSPYHFDRMVYVRLFKSLKASLAEGCHPASGWALHERDDLDQALADEHAADVLSRTAKFLLDSDKAASAANFAAKAVQSAPGARVPRLIQLECQLANLHAPAADDVEKLIAAIQPPPALLHRIGTRLFDQGRFDAAAAVFGGAADREPVVFVHRHRQANALERAGRPEEAYATFKQCCDAGEANPHVLAHMARLLIGAGSYDCAKALLAECLISDPSFPPYLSALATLKEARANIISIPAFTH